MKNNFWLQRVVEACLLAISIYLLYGKFVEPIIFKSELTIIQNLFQVIPIIVLNLVIVCSLQLIKRVIYFFNQSVKIDFLENIIIDIYILLFVSVLLSSIVVFGGLLPVIHWDSSLDMLKSLFDNDRPTIVSILVNLGIFFILHIPLIFILFIFSPLFQLLIYFTYEFYQKKYHKYNKFICLITFISLQIVNLIILSIGSITVFFVLFVVFIIIGSLPNILLSGSNVAIILGVGLTYLGLNVILFFIIAIAAILPPFIGFTISKFSKLRFSSAIDKIFLGFTWFYIQKLSFFVKNLLPYSLWGFISDYIYIWLIQNALSYSLINNSTLKAYESRKFAAQFTEELLKKKFTFINIADKYRFIINLASKLLLFGDLNLADKLYTKLWNSAKSNNNSFLLDLDKAFDALCYYYIETYQYNLLDFLIKESSIQLEENRISRLTYLSNLMRSAYASKSYSEFTSQGLDTYLSSGNILSILLDLSYIYEKDHVFKIKNPEDLFKHYLQNNLKDENSKYMKNFLKNNRQDLQLILEELQVIFKVQNKIYLFICTQNAEHLPTEENINLALRNEIITNTFGIEIRLINPFFRDNNKLIPLVYLFAENTSEFTNLNKLIASANEEGRHIDAAFIKCCQGKILVKNHSIHKGLELIEEGIKCYENLRHSVSTDQIGIGFGSNYLEYYDWAIDALIQEENFRKAFDYAERSTARALLDLLSSKTIRPHSLKGSTLVVKLIVKIRNIDFNISFLQNSIYEAPLLNNYLPSIVKNKIEKEFYKIKGEKLNYLVKQRDSLIKDLEAIDPVSATLFEIKPLTWKATNNSEDNYIPLEYLWQNEVIAHQDAILSFHVIHKFNFADKNKPWDKIICFAVFKEKGTLRLHQHIVAHPQTVADIQKNCQNVANEMRSMSRQKSLSVVSKHLIFPLLISLPKDCNSLTITANSDLHFFPWSALYYNDEYNDSKRLIDKFRIRTTPSLSLLYLLKQREDFRETKIPIKFLIAGIKQYPAREDYLFWSGVEVEYISQVYTSNSVIQLKDEDVDQFFADEFRQAEVIHYSGHANYQRSYSRLDALDKTYLSLYHKKISATEILDGALENPNAKVMILSACLTGRGDLTTSGSEILGLERALFHAGLSSLLTTLWPVEQFSTALLMLKLHTVWHQHNNTLANLASSLREAQIWLKNISWLKLKQEFPEIEQEVSNCLAAYQVLIANSKNQDERNRLANISEYYQNVTNRLISDSTEKPFRHPYFWAAFQVKGIG